MKDSAVTLYLMGSLFLFLAAMLTLTMAQAAIPPSGIDSAFDARDEKAVTDAIISSDLFKQAVAEAIKTREARKAEIKGDPKKTVGISPAQAARVRFIEILSGKGKP